MDIRKGLGMAKSYAEAMISRGLTNKKTDPTIKKLRVLSCFGKKVRNERMAIIIRLLLRGARRQRGERVWTRAARGRDTTAPRGV